MSLINHRHSWFGDHTRIMSINALLLGFDEGYEALNYCSTSTCDRPVWGAWQLNHVLTLPLKRKLTCL